MTENPAPVQPGGYGDTLAMNDIHAVLTSTCPHSADDTVQAITDILARTGRSPYPSRVITATVEDDPHGLPAACIDAEGTIVTIGQDPDGPGIIIAISPRDPADEAALVIAVDGRIVRRARPGSLRPVPGRPGGPA